MPTTTSTITFATAFPGTSRRSPYSSMLGLPALVLVLLTLTSAQRLAAVDWPQWGGPGRDFHAADVDLVPWPAGGPKVLWSHPLGAGYSAIVAHEGNLYTLYREGREEIVVSLDAESGSRRWSHRYEVTPAKGMRLNFGAGPHSTPLLADGKVYTIGTTGTLWALDAESGKALWHHDLWGELGGSVLLRGYASSPIAYGDTIIVTVGGEGHGVMAFALDDGEVLWQRQSLFNSPSSPILIEVGGQQQLVAFVKDEVVAIDPRDGELLWRHPHPSTASYNVSTPIWEARDQLLFFSSGYDGGSRVLRLSVQDGASRVEELWHNKRLRIHFTNAVRLGDFVYGSHGNPGAVFLLALNVKTGDLAWRDREVKRANFVVVGENVLILESEGRLLLARLSPQGLAILSEVQLFEGKAWTVPTLVGHHLFARDEERITALGLPVARVGESLQGQEDSAPR